MMVMMKWKMKWKNNIDESENGWKGSEGRREYIGWEYRMVKWNGWMMISVNSEQVEDWLKRGWVLLKIEDMLVWKNVLEWFKVKVMGIDNEKKDDEGD